MRRTLEIIEAAVGEKTYSVSLMLQVQSPTDDRNAIKKSVQGLMKRMRGKSAGVKGGTVKIRSVETRKVIGAEGARDWFAGMFA